MVGFRIGQGYDVHRLMPGRKLILGGCEIPFHLGLLGHSDADVLIHSVVDALLGTLSMGDIGTNFPDSDEHFRDANSLDLLETVCERIWNAGYVICNIDSTVVLQLPKIARYIPNIKENIAKTCKIDLKNISIKAKTEEGLGFTGKLYGIKSFAVCLIKRV